MQMRPATVFVDRQITLTSLYVTETVCEGAVCGLRAFVFIFRMIHAVDWFPTILDAAGVKPGKSV